MGALFWGTNRFSYPCCLPSFRLICEMYDHEIIHRTSTSFVSSVWGATGSIVSDRGESETHTTPTELLAGGRPPPRCWCSRQKSPYCHTAGKEWQFPPTSEPKLRQSQPGFWNHPHEPHAGLRSNLAGRIGFVELSLHTTEVLQLAQNPNRRITTNTKCCDSYPG